MQNYFPYSSIISNSSKQNISKHPFFGEWNVCGSENSTNQQAERPAISEIYY